MTKIYSMASCSRIYPIYEAAKSGSKTPKRTAAKKIEIKGGANVSDPITGVAPKCVETEVSAADLKLLQELPNFKKKIANGWYVIDKKPTEFKSDGSAQITEAQMAKKTKAKATTGETEELK